MREQHTTGLISLKDAANMLGLSVETLHKYKGLGIIQPVIRRGRKDFFDRDYIQAIGHLIRKRKSTGRTIKDIAEEIKYLWHRPDHPSHTIKKMGARKILIVDDDHIFVDILIDKIKASFGIYDISIMAAYDGIEAIAMAQRNRPDLIILDVCLPKKDGTVVYDELNQLKEFDHCKFIIITGTLTFTPPGSVMLTKPCRTDELFDEIRKALNMP